MNIKRTLLTMFMTAGFGLHFFYASNPVRADIEVTHQVMIWSGYVDNTSIVNVQGRHIWTNTTRGKGVYQEDYWLSSPLPEEDVRVFSAYPCP